VRVPKKKDEPKEGVVAGALQLGGGEKFEARRRYMEKRNKRGS
jgi:hypothetical protein